MVIFTLPVALIDLATTLAYALNPRVVAIASAIAEHTSLNNVMFARIYQVLGLSDWNQ